MATHKQNLIARITARNLANKYVGELSPLVIQALAPFVGQKIVNANRTLALKVKTVLPEFVRPGFRWYLEITGSSIWLKCDQCESIKDGVGCVYEDVNFYVADLGEYNSVTLKKLNEEKFLVRVYSLDVIEAKTKELEIARQKVRDIENELAPFCPR